MPFELAIRVGAFASAFIVMGVWEALSPRRRQSPERRQRWPGNIGVVLLDAVAVRVVAPFGAAGVAVFVQENGLGLFNAVVLPRPVSFLASIVLLDAAIYAQHVGFHYVPSL